MKWDKYSIHTTTEAEDLVCALLLDFGIEGVEIENATPVLDADKQGGYFAELQPDLPVDDGSSVVSFYLEDGEDHGALLSQIREALLSLADTTSIGSGMIESSISDEADWRNRWKEYFHSFSIGDLYFKPTWEDMPEDLDPSMVIEMDPGVSFGTGKHESTQLVIRQLQTYGTKGQRVLDVGCGSGILSIVALKLGARSVTGCDIDEDCIASSYENCERNGYQNVAFYVGNLIDDTALQKKVGDDYDIVVANILADIIIPMAPALYHSMREGALLVTSGIIDFKEHEVRDALLSSGFSVVETDAMGEWRSITARK